MKYRLNWTASANWLAFVHVQMHERGLSIPKSPQNQVLQTTLQSKMLKAKHAAPDKK